MFGGYTRETKMRIVVVVYYARLREYVSLCLCVLCVYALQIINIAIVRSMDSPSLFFFWFALVG